MFGKMTFLLVSLGVVGCSLLALRQQRLQAASEAAQAQLRIRAADERLFELRALVAARITPGEVEKLAAQAGGLRPATNDIPGDLTSNALTGLGSDGRLLPPEEPARDNPPSRPAPRDPAGKPGKQDGAKPGTGKPAKPGKSRPGSGPSRYADGRE